MKLIAQWELDCFPPSTNKLQRSGPGFRFDTEEYRQFKIDAANCFRADGFQCFMNYQGKKLYTWFEYYWSGWLTKKGEIYDRDASNRHKALEDALFRYLKLKDSQVWDYRDTKRQPEPGRDRYCKVYLYLIEEETNG